MRCPTQIRRCSIREGKWRLRRNRQDQVSTGYLALCAGHDRVVCSDFSARQPAPESRAVTEFAGHAGLTTVVQDNVFDNRQAQASATGLARAPLVHAVKPFKQSRQML